MVAIVLEWLRTELASGPFMVAIRWKDGTVENLLRIDHETELCETAEYLADNMPFPSCGVFTDVR